MTSNEQPLGEYIGDGYRVASIQPDEEPSLILSARYLTSFASTLQAAYARALAVTPGQDMEAVLTLCETLRPALKRHEQATREWLASRPLSGGVAEMQKQLDDVRRMLDEWQ